MKPLLMGDSEDEASTTALPNIQNVFDAFFAQYFSENPEFFKQASKFLFCFCGLQASYLTWGYMQVG